MKPFRTWLLLSALLLAGACDRLAGTEVGNPEITTVAARFAIHDTDAYASVSELNLKVMGMGWNAGADTGVCWNKPDGHMIDFASDAQPPLPEVAIKASEWYQAEMILQSPGGDSTLPDTSAFADWSNPRYVKLVKVMEGDTVRALFELPQGLRLRLRFTKATIDSWHQDHRMTVLVQFDAGKWAAALPASRFFSYRLDGKHARYILLSPTENSDAFAVQRALLPKCFMADSTDTL